MWDLPEEKEKILFRVHCIWLASECPDSPFASPQRSSLVKDQSGSLQMANKPVQPEPPSFPHHPSPLGHHCLSRAAFLVKEVSYVP